MADTGSADRSAGTIDGEGRRMTLAEEELIGSLGWLVSMRWVAGVSVVVAALAASRLLRLPVPERALVGVGLFILIYNAGLRWWLGGLGRSEPGSTLGHARPPVQGCGQPPDRPEPNSSRARNRR